MVGFLQTTWTHTDPSTCHQLCDAPSLTFALRVAAILLNALHLQLWTKSGTSSDEAGCMEGCDDKTEGATWKHYVDVISDLTEMLLIGAQQLSYWEQGSVRRAYFVASKALIYHRCPSNVCQKAGESTNLHVCISTKTKCLKCKPNSNKRHSGFFFLSFFLPIPTCRQRDLSWYM